MSLFGSIQMGANTARALQIGLHVVGNNIANANTPGFVREEVVYKPAPVQRIGNLVLGLGVEIDGIVQQADRLTQSRLIGATSDRAGAEIQEEAYNQLEAVIGELSDTDISTSLTTFFNSIHDVLNQPESASVRNLAVLQGDALAQDVNRLSQRVRNLRLDFDGRAKSLANEINSLTEQIAKFNLNIASVGGGEAGTSDAGALRDQRFNAVRRLAEIVDIQVQEQPSGALNVSLAGESLVIGGIVREVVAGESSNRGITVNNVLFADSQSELASSGGELAGLVAARDEILGDFTDRLDEFASALVFEFNRLHTQGQGLSGFTSLTSEFATDDPEAARDVAGLTFTPNNGAFDVLVRNQQSGLYETTTIQVDLNGIDGDSTLNSIAAALNDVDGIQAEITLSGELQLTTESLDDEFAFAGDTSGFLAAIGLNTFFSGSAAGDLGVNEVLLEDASKLAASRGGIGEDTENAVLLADFLDAPLESRGGQSIAELYRNLINETAQGATVSKSLADGFRTFEATLDGRLQAITGVSVDEEAVQLITLQRVFQANARFIATISEILDTLINL